MSLFCAGGDCMDMYTKCGSFSEAHLVFGRRARCHYLDYSDPRFCPTWVLLGDQVQFVKLQILMRRESRKGMLLRKAMRLFEAFHQLQRGVLGLLWS